MFIHNGKEIVIPRALKEELKVNKSTIIRCNNIHLPLILDYTFDELRDGVMYNYVVDMKKNELAELTHLFSTLELSRYMDFLVYLIEMTWDLD